MLKRLFDTVLSALLLLLLSPVLLILAATVRLTMGRPVLYTQMRPGLREQPFRIIKFRTMVLTGDDGELLPPEQRITKPGALMRSTGLDELPELINVMKGEMSLVGPRPLRMEYLGHYNERQKRRHNVRPGITGWAQIHGRSRLDWDERLEMDAWYVDNRSLWLDLKILFWTLMLLFKPAEMMRDGSKVTRPFKEIDLHE